jgi:quinol-cytochrome oxidoreductase complex cytochrome b subunit
MQVGQFSQNKKRSNRFFTLSLSPACLSFISKIHILLMSKCSSGGREGERERERERGGKEIEI